MDEGTSGSGGVGESSSSASKIAPSYVKLGDRQIFSVELRPGETTFVSWKKLMKDANKGSIGSTSVPDPPPPNIHPNLQSRLASGQPPENEAKEPPPPNRFSAVIEKIERLYMGKDSSDDEDLKDVPDDDQYDTEDSFIDDADLDEYFEVDNSAIKHSGFFVNRGKLERIEPIVVPNQQAKKRRRKDLNKAPVESDDGRTSNKHVKMEAIDIEKPKTSGLQAKILTNKSKDVSGSLDASNQKYHDKCAYPQSKLQPAKSITRSEEHESSGRPKEKNSVRELPDLNMPDGKISMQVTKPSHVHRRDGSSVRHKGSVLENAIRELEKMVAESRPPTSENQEADTSYQAIKRRLPREIKMKLAKVARLAAREGKVSKELINRLMSILGHLIQLRTLKRNLKVMISMSLSAKQEKDDRFQQIKKEVAEMIKTLCPSQALEQAGVSTDLQEISSQEKAALKRKFTMDAVLEDKICDLYDLFVEGLDEDAGPQVRKLYVELAGLWPSGLMDNHGIKRAICRAKERRRALYSRHKEQENLKNKKMLAPRSDESVRVDSGSIALQQPMREKLPTDTGGPVLALASNSISSAATSAARVPGPSVNTPNADRPKQEKPKASSSNLMDEAKTGADGALAKKSKKKTETDMDETQIRSEKLHTEEKERTKSLKQAAALPQKLNLQLTTPSSFEQSS